jgi:glycosyltransferase involved in cell wall biosynthesis
MKRIAIIHDSLLHIGGAEKVLFKFIRAYQNADVYISLLDFRLKNKLKTKGEIHTSVFSSLPFVSKYASFLKPFIILYWETLNLQQYDLVISSSHSFSSKSINKAKIAKHVSYIHTPPKYLYDEFNEMNWIKSFPFNIIFWPFFYLLKRYDFYSAQKPDLLIANSKNVQSRIKKYYKRNSVVIYPPHNTAPANFKKKKGEYYLFFSRLEKQKGAELVVKTCTKYNLPLVVVGTGSQEKYLKSITGKTVKFKGFVNEADKIDIFSRAKALLYASIDEDYGMVIPEVLSYGIPVVAYDSGAVEEMADKNIFIFKRYDSKSLYSFMQKNSI